MNTLLSVLVSDAYRVSNITNINSVLTDAQQAEGFRYLQRIIWSVYGFEAGELLTDFPQGQNTIIAPGGFPAPVPNNFFFPLNARVVCNYTAPATIALHPMPEDGSRFAILDENSIGLNVTIQANGRLIEGASSYSFTVPKTHREWFYDAPSGNWNVVSPLTITDVCPFPSAFDDMFIMMLAMRLNPSYTTTMAPESQLVLKDIMKKFKARYHQVIKMPSELALILTPGARWERGGINGWGYGGPTSIFTNGWANSYGWGGY